MARPWFYESDTTALWNHLRTKWKFKGSLPPKTPFPFPFKRLPRRLITVTPVVRLRATLQYCHAMLVFWLEVCSEQVAIQISVCCLSKRFFILEYCELTAMASNITSVSKRERVISLWSSGYRNKEICSRLHLSHQTVSNILSKFLQTGTAAPGKPGWKERTVATANVVEFVEYCKVAPWVDSDWCISCITRGQWTSIFIFSC